MCGRFGNSNDPRVIAEYHDALNYAKNGKPTWNAAPTQQLPIVFEEPVERDIARDGTTAVEVADGAASGLSVERKLILARWGWRRDFGASGWLPPNVRGEEAATKKTFAEALRFRRCIIPATCFYEWREDTRQPYAFTLASGAPFGIAGIWEPTPEGIAFLLLTAVANAVVAPIHHRMACILPRADEAAWLAATTPAEAIQCLIRPYPGEMKAQAISHRINSVKNDGPELLEPVAPPEQLRLF